VIQPQDVPGWRLLRWLFGRLLADSAWNLNHLCSLNVTSLIRMVSVYEAGNDHPLCDLNHDGLDTAEVWGSSPHAPTTSLPTHRKSCHPEAESGVTGSDVSSALVNRLPGTRRVFAKKKVGQ
jgi:hypothetical protein